MKTLAESFVPPDDRFIKGLVSTSNTLFCGNARVCDNTLMYDNVKVYGNAEVYEEVLKTDVSF